MGIRSRGSCESRCSYLRPDIVTDKYCISLAYLIVCSSPIRCADTSANAVSFSQMITSAFLSLALYAGAFYHIRRKLHHDKPASEYVLSNEDQADEYAIKLSKYMIWYPVSSYPDQNCLPPELYASSYPTFAACFRLPSSASPSGEEPKSTLER